MSALVVDDSAALRLLAGGSGRDEVRARLRTQILAAEPILVPPVFWLHLIELVIGPAHGGRPLATAVEAIYELEQLGLETADVGRPGALATIDAVGRGAGVRQAAYLVLAESADADLLTASPSLAAVAGQRAMLVGGRRTGRAPRPDRSWIGWKGAVAYLRELRSTF